jgi:hypothetical protein
MEELDSAQRLGFRRSSGGVSRWWRSDGGASRWWRSDYGVRPAVERIGGAATVEKSRWRCDCSGLGHRNKRAAARNEEEDGGNHRWKRKKDSDPLFTG